MAKKNAGNPPGKQVNQYNKILHENMEAFLPELIKKVLKINVVTGKELPDNVQFAKERKPEEIINN